MKNNLLFRPNQTIEIQWTKAKVILVLWALWSGKTHFINSLLPYTPPNTKILVNDIGSINIDAKRLKNPNITTLSEWCVCCEDLGWLKKALIEAKNEEVIIIEPSWIAGWDDLISLVKNLGFDLSVITLQDVEHFSKRTSTEIHIMENQIKVADIIGYTWISENFSEVQKWVEKNNSWAKNFLLQNPENENIPQNPLLQEIYSLLSQKTAKQVFKILWNTPKEKPKHQNSLLTYSWIDEIASMNFEWLQIFLKNHPHMIRAKWVIENISFNYTHGSLEIEWYSQENNYANFISEIPLKIPQNISFKNRTMSQKNIQIIPESEFPEKISTLVAQYHERMNLEMQIKSLETKFKLFKYLSKFRTEEEISEKKAINAQMIQTLQLKQKILWDAMKYDNPHIWLKYKIEAYKNSSWKIETLADLKKHAQSPTYICHKRLQFLNQYTKEKFWKDIFDESLDQDMSVKDFYAWDDTIASLDVDFMQEWLNYEYFEIKGKTAKWENYKK